VRASCSGHCVSADEAARWSRDRGRKSTGSYEGSPTMEGIPDHHEPQVFTGRRSRWSWRLLHSPKKAGEGRAHGDWKKERRQGCQRLDRSRAPWEENAHARSRSRPTTCEARGQRSQHAIQNVVSSTIRRSESSAVKALGPPVKPSGAQTPGGAHAMKVAAGCRERTRCGCTQFRLGGRSRSDALRVLPTGRSQVLVVKKHGRALARRKLEAPLTRGTSG
jgi:hypothetical protein